MADQLQQRSRTIEEAFCELTRYRENGDVYHLRRAMRLLASLE